jgi:hypothetical protein
LLLDRRNERKEKKGVIKVQKNKNGNSRNLENEEVNISNILFSILKVQAEDTGSFCFHFVPAHHVPIDVLIEPFHVL